MSFTEQIRSAFTSVLADFGQSPAMRRIAQGLVTKAHYVSFLKEVSHYAREDPQIQVLAAVYFRGAQRDLVKGFFKHATTEIGHDQLALNDIAALGVDATRVPFERPLPSTISLISFPFYQIQFLNPVGYLGYLYFLEFMPTQQGGSYKQLLARVGIPEEAMTFISDHTTIDIGHNRFMETYIEKLVTTQEECDSVIYAMKVTGMLYAEMIQGAFAQVDSPRDFGLSAEELRFASRTVKRAAS